MSSSISLTLNPVPGFCVKSSALQQAVVPRTATSLLASAPSDTPGAIPKGLKVFVNIAWDTNVPPPPPGSEDTIQKVIRGQHYNESNSDGWFIPVLVSDPRDDKDKAGKPALVVDCVLNPSVKPRTLKEAHFKAFIIELALQRVESHTTLALSRQISTPNIASKGKPVSRQVLVPRNLFPPGHPHHKSDAKTTLIQELASPTVIAPASKVEWILKSATPTWTWTPTKDHRKIRFIINVPNLTRAQISNSTLDVEPRRVILHVPSLYDLDINLDVAPDTEPTTATYGRLGEGATVTELKRFRDLDVDGAKAEWRVAEKVIVILA
ncbi:pre-RNA processing PIH1/Nop17-domain-containing protein [Suillus plorans]|uniref:Pre-RNA processing PIH1/Nop17-domain-containing protein n=1 Tax=Suillus plorans TaxID=116603 RepID=A0A9P7DR32_9AGAM|nr:pre-RNA processing PIH1/Nop17-domain-containing protein [Suillus plorans]KAG1801014.1 pre-RNA processing PIH1/Nop17-domain-containing protein [Suillus plorans]